MLTCKYFSNKSKCKKERDHFNDSVLVFCHFYRTLTVLTAATLHAIALLSLGEGGSKLYSELIDKVNEHVVLFQSPVQFWSLDDTVDAVWEEATRLAGIAQVYYGKDLCWSARESQAGKASWDQVLSLQRKAQSQSQQMKPSVVHCQSAV